MKKPLYTPKVRADKSRRRLIELLSQQLNDRLISENSNVGEGEIVLSYEEELELERLVGEALTSKDFLLSLWFADQISQSGLQDEARLREIYLSERKVRGRSRAISSAQWYSFVTRLGLRRGDLSTLMRSATRMPFEHFQRMEGRLLSELRVPVRARAYILDAVEKCRSQIESARKIGELRVGEVTKLNIQENTKALLEEIRERSGKLSVNQVAGLTTVVANTTAIFSTRDWSVTGTLSTFAGGVVMATVA